MPRGFGVGSLSLAESGALALDHAASILDRAGDGGTFVAALAHNRRVWRALNTIAHRDNWPLPDRRQAEFALGATAKAGVSDDDVHALQSINRQVARALAGNDIERVRRRAHAIWEARGRPQGQALDHWLLAELEVTGDDQAG